MYTIGDFSGLNRRARITTMFFYKSSLTYYLLPCIANALNRRSTLTGRSVHSSRKHAYIILAPLNPTFIY